MGYRVKSDLHDGQSTPEMRRSRYVFWLLPLFVLGPNLGRIAKGLGVKASPELVLVATVTMGIVCIVAAIISYKNAKTMVARDLAELANPLGR